MIRENEVFEDLLWRLSRVYSDIDKAPIHLHEPEFSDTEKEYLSNCIDSGFVSSVGKYVEEFEDCIARYTGSKYAVSVVNGTSALQLALASSDLPKGSEILIPSMSFVATANAAVHGGFIPHFVNSNEKSLGIDPIKLEAYLNKISHYSGKSLTNINTGRVISAIIPMHCFGHPVELESLTTICEKFRLTIIEDAAEALGSFNLSHHCGTQSHCGILSFNGNKIVTTGGGGAILTNNQDLYLRAKHLSTTARISQSTEFEHDEIGYNFRMPSINAALGLGQMKTLEDKITRKRNLALKLIKNNEEFKHGYFYKERDGCCSNYWLNTLILHPDVAFLREKIIKFLNANKIFARPCWKPLHLLPMFRESPRDNLKQTEGLVNRIINVPSSPQLYKP